VRRLEPPIWREGTRITPQLLQYHDRRLADTTRFQWSALTFRPWGFHTLQIDHEALAAGVLAISSGSGILSDGLAFDMPGSDPLPEPIPLGNSVDFGTEAREFCLALPRGREHGPRSRPAIQMLRDENTGIGEKPVQVSHRRFVIVGGAEAAQGMSVLRLARVRVSAGGVYELDPRFVPPLLDVGASGFLTSMLRRLIENLAARSTSIAASRRARNLTLADFPSADIPNFWLLYTVNTWLPVFRHFFESRMAHPETLYSALIEFAATLTAFSPRKIRELPIYDHENLEGCFGDLDWLLRLLLDTVVPSNWVSMPLKEVQPSIFVASIHDDRRLAGARMYLAVRVDGHGSTVAEKAPKLVKVASSGHIDRLIRQALPGVVLTHVAEPPGSAPVKRGFVYFALGQEGEAWEAVAQSRSLAAYVPAELPRPELELLAISTAQGG
jgi:type VI secretion system protein ImpJ